jgi:dolichol-phosphate mannosyltransferase
MTELTGQSGPLDLTVMLPAYKEADSLRDLLPAIKAAAAALTPDFEILILDTQTAMDDTAEVCAFNGVRHIRRSGGNRFGDAIRTGIAEARGRHLLCMDADGSHSPSYIQTMWARREEFDIVIGSRYVAGAHTEASPILICMSYAVNLSFRLVFNIHAKDMSNSFRLYRTALLKPMGLDSNHFDILEEILIKAVTYRPPARICEVPIIFCRRKAGESKRKLLLFALGYLITLRRMRKFQKAARREMNSQ